MPLRKQRSPDSKRAGAFEKNNSIIGFWYFGYII